jgi:F0F1-type ATP synthase assembly protein I
MLLTDDLTSMTDQQLAKWCTEAEGRREYEILGEQEWKRRSRIEEQKLKSPQSWHETFIGKVIVGVVIGVIVIFAGIFIGKYITSAPLPQQQPQLQQPPIK